MATEDEFAGMLRGLRVGHPDAVRGLVSEYEPYLRRTLRRRLAGTPLQAAADSVDLCQSVFGTFLIRFAAGELDVRTPDELTKLLLAITKKKFARLLRREAAARRDRSRTVPLGSDPHHPDARCEDPSVVLARTELLGELQSRLAGSERELFRLRCDEHSWDEIAELLGEPAPRLRKRFSRAVQAACQELNLESPDD
jgi:DNA-directed RNA polymerase specialized sigma24 family protein